MDLKSNRSSPVLTDPAPKSIPGMHPTLWPCSPRRAAFSTLLLTVPMKKTGILDDVRSSCWLDAMKSSSPSPKKITKAVNNEYASYDADVEYNAWMVFSLPVVIFPFGSFFFWMSCLYCSLHLSILISQVKYPSAIAFFEKITDQAKGKRIALFLDYDGTLSPIVDNPDCAFMSDAVRGFFPPFTCNFFNIKVSFFFFLSFFFHCLVILAL